MATDAAPEPKSPGEPDLHLQSPSLVAPPRKLSEELARLQELFAERSVRLEEVISVLHGRAYLLLLVLLSLPFITPIPLPGLSTPFGLVVALIGLRLALGMKPWLPQKLLHTTLPPGFFGKLIQFTRRVVSFLEKFLRPRWLAVTETELLQRFHAFVICVAGLVLLLPLPIPFTNTFPAWAILLLACGLLERDGLFALMGHIVFVVGIAYFILLGETTERLMQTLKHWLFS